jgi:hypothetical protein
MEEERRGHRRSKYNLQLVLLSSLIKVAVKFCKLEECTHGSLQLWNGDACTPKGIAQQSVSCRSRLVSSIASTFCAWAPLSFKGPFLVAVYAVLPALGALNSSRILSTDAFTSSFSFALGSNTYLINDSLMPSNSGNSPFMRAVSSRLFDRGATMTLACSSTVKFSLQIHT